MTSSQSDARDLQLFRMSFDGRLLERGFWLYIWRIGTLEGDLLYVGRTGDSSSPHAASPFNRIGQHLNVGSNAKGNALGRQLAKAGVQPRACTFDMVAVGPLFPEQTDMDAHRPLRDRTAALEKALAELLRRRGYHVLGVHHCIQTADTVLLARISDLINAVFPGPASPAGSTAQQGAAGDEGRGKLSVGDV
jgi:hypothetical protein